MFSTANRQHKEKSDFLFLGTAGNRETVWQQMSKSLSPQATSGVLKHSKIGTAC